MSSSYYTCDSVENECCCHDLSYYHENKYTVSTSQIIPFNNVSVPIEEWNNNIITFFGTIGLLLFSKSFDLNDSNCIKNISVSHLPLVQHIEGIVNVIVYPQLQIIFDSPSPEGEIELDMPIPLPPLMSPSSDREIVIFDEKKNYDPFGFISEQFIPFKYATVRIDRIGKVSLFINMKRIENPLQVISTKQFVLQFKL